MKGFRCGFPKAMFLSFTLKGNIKQFLKRFSCSLLAALTDQIHFHSIKCHNPNKLQNWCVTTAHRTFFCAYFSPYGMLTDSNIYRKPFKSYTFNLYVCLELYSNYRWCKSFRRFRRLDSSQHCQGGA